MNDEHEWDRRLAEIEESLGIYTTPRPPTPRPHPKEEVVTDEVVAMAVRVMEMERRGTRDLDPLKEVCRVEAGTEGSPIDWDWAPRPTPYDRLSERELVLLAAYHLRNYVVWFPREQMDEKFADYHLSSAWVSLEQIRVALGGERFDILITPLVSKELGRLRKGSEG